MNDLPNTIQRVSNISYADFRKNNLLPNQPLIIGANLIENWSCLTLWRDTKSPSRSDGGPASEMGRSLRFDALSTPNLAYLKRKYGDFTVPVDEDACRTEKPLREVIDIWERDDKSTGSDSGDKLYVKDWHLALQLEQASAAADSTTSLDKQSTFYKTPDIFADDWMNLYYRKNTPDDFRFVYMGPVGTFTRLHRDVYTSYSWSTNVVGRKRWWLFPPSVTSHIAKPNGETIADGSLIGTSPEPDTVDEANWPGWNIAKQAMYVVEQEEGETIFVPSGWYHQVLNLTFCISINHNWSNAHNLKSMYHSMVEAVERVETSIEDVKDLLQKRLPEDEWEAEWRKVVQDLVKQDAGWDWSTFLGMVLLGVKDCLAPEGSSQLNNGFNEHGCGIHPTLMPVRALTQQFNLLCGSAIHTLRVDFIGIHPSTCFFCKFDAPHHSDPQITPDREYVLGQVFPCIAHFTASSWGQSGEYDESLSRIRRLISQ